MLTLFYCLTKVPNESKSFLTHLMRECSKKIEFECIITDDASTDSSHDIALEIESFSERGLFS